MLKKQTHFLNITETSLNFKIKSIVDTIKLEIY